MGRIFVSGLAWLVLKQRRSPRPYPALRMITPPFIQNSLLAHKRRRLDAAASVSSPSFQFHDDIESEGDSNNEEDEVPVSAFAPQPGLASRHAASFSSSNFNRLDLSVWTSVDDSVRVHHSAEHHSADHLEAASQAVRLRIALREQSNKSTTLAYERHVKAYAEWWSGYQAEVLKMNPTQVAIPAFPVTAAKATMFLEYTSTRPKRRHGSNKKIQGSIVGMSVIKQTISALENHRFQHQHLYKHVPESQMGLRHDACIRCFETASQHNEPKCVESAQVLKAKGSSSDTYTKEELEQCLLSCLTDFSGPKQIFVGLRDRAMLLLSMSTALRGASCRVVELSDLFPANIPSADRDRPGIEVNTSSPDEPMPYKTHNDRVNLIHFKNEVLITKSMHAGRPYAAQTARAHSASISGTKALGGWSKTMFNAQSDTHFQPRNALEPPAELLAAVFPWVEQEQDNLTQRQASGSQADDIALKQLLRLLVWLRCVLLQDCAVLYAKYPSCPMFRYSPFDSPAFRQFASSSLSMVDQAEEEVRQVLKNLPKDVAATFRGLAMGIRMDQHTQRVDATARWDTLDGHIDQVTGLLQLLIGSKSFKGGRKANEVLGALQNVRSTPDLCNNVQAISDVSPSHSFAPSSAASIPSITINISNPSAAAPKSGVTCAVLRSDPARNATTHRQRKCLHERWKNCHDYPEAHTWETRDQKDIEEEEAVRALVAAEDDSYLAYDEACRVRQLVSNLITRGRTPDAGRKVITGRMRVT
ncbi:hypothetical protein EI94DRAFT_1807551 [Lactarius quietus]|nr:hypothetical protein EI94DRAFT_1807551 [Lactarius quietus]